VAVSGDRNVRNFCLGQRRVGASWSGTKAVEEGFSYYLYGEISYEDIFKVHHRTWFCRRFNGKQFVLGDLNDEKYNGFN
jgi:hypothetical protein